MALADQSLGGQPEIYRLLAYRFPTDHQQPALREWLTQMVRGNEPMIRAIADPKREIIRSHLQDFEQRMPADFDLRGASIGNLILTGGFLAENRQIDPVIERFSRLVEARGVVRPVSSRYLHLAADLEDGQQVVGQHRLTGKEAPPLASPIKRLYLTRSQHWPRPENAPIGGKVKALIRQADLICYPMGSFYSSVLACLLPQGVGDAVAATDVPKLYIPSTGRDPELIGHSLSQAVKVLLQTLRQGSAGQRQSDLLQTVLVDRNATVDERRDFDALRRLGVAVLEASLVTDESRPLLDARRLTEVLVSLA
jgi:CofD-related protein of GAK system